MSLPAHDAVLEPSPAVFSNDHSRHHLSSTRLKESLEVSTLRGYLLILVLGVMLPGTLLTGVLMCRVSANTRAASERRLLELARADAAALDREFEGTISTLEALATWPELDRNDLVPFHAKTGREAATPSTAK